VGARRAGGGGGGGDNEEAWAEVAARAVELQECLGCEERGKVAATGGERGAGHVGEDGAAVSMGGRTCAMNDCGRLRYVLKK
jgi:hypothetical protein